MGQAKFSKDEWKQIIGSNLDMTAFEAPDRFETVEAMLERLTLFRMTFDKQTKEGTRKFYRELLRFYFRNIQDFNLDEILGILYRKRLDYGNESIIRTGELGILIRLIDKLCRIKNLLEQNNPNFESLRDSWIDSFNYIVIYFEYWGDSK